MTAALGAPARALLADLQGVNAMGEGSLKSWGSKRRPQLPLSRVEALALELVDAGLATREVLSDGRSKYRARERSPEPPPVEVVTEPGYDWIPNSTGAAGPFYGVDRSPEPKKKAKKSPVVYVNRCAVCGRDDGAPGRCAFCHELGYEEPEAPAPCAECARTATDLAGILGAHADESWVGLLAGVRAAVDERDRLAEALLSWERQWGVNGTDLAAMEARVQEAETRVQELRLDRNLERMGAVEMREELAEALGADDEEGWGDLIDLVKQGAARLAAVELERDQLAAALVKAKASTSAPAEPALSTLTRLPVEQRRLVGLALQELALEALGGALGAARAEAFAARPDLGPRLSENAAAVLEVLSPDRGQTPREIGKKVQVNQNSVHTALRSLEKHGLATNATYGFWRRAS